MTETATESNEPEEAPVKVLRWFHWWTVVGASLVLTVAAWRFSETQLERQSMALFHQEANELIELVEERLRMYEVALRGGASAVQALGGRVSLEEWRTFAQTAQIEREYPGIAGVGIIERVPREDVASYVTERQAERPDFSIHPHMDVEEHFPISYIEPARGNMLAVGLDMTHEANRFDGVVRVRDSGTAQLAGPITLVQDEQHLPGFLLFVPFYNGASQSMEDRRASFDGIVFAPFVVRELMVDTLSSGRRPVGLRINDGSTTLYDEHVPSEPDYDPTPQYSVTHEVPLFGRTWVFDLRSTRSFRAAAASRQPRLILLGGIVIDVLLLALFILMTRSNQSVRANNRTLHHTISLLENAQRALQSTTATLSRRDVELQQQRRAALNIAADAKQAQQKAEEAEQRSTVVVESAPNAMVMIDDAGMIVLVNAETERIFGHPRERLLGQPIEGMIPIRDDDTVNIWSGLIQTTEPLIPSKQRNLWGVRSDDTEFPVEVGLNPIHTPQGRFVLSAIVDVSERQDAQRRFEQAVESAPNAMVMVDEAGLIVLVNAEAERIFGYARDEMLGEPVERLVPFRSVDGQPRVRESLFVPSDTRTVSDRHELFAVRKDGSEFPVEIGLNPIDTREGRFVLSAIVDNTEHKRILDQLEHRTEEMEQLLYTVSHDLKSPLVTIQGFSSMIAEALERNDVEDARDSAARVSRATKTMAALINDVLALSRVARAADECAWVDVESLVGDVADSLNAQFTKTGARLTVQDGLPTIRTVESRVHQIFSNLIGNALKYGCEKPGSVVEVGFVDAPRHHKFFVRDHGPGIDPTNHRKAFVIFRRLNTKKEGSGLGLAIVMKAARSLGGQAWLDSTPGEGATFWFSVAKKHHRQEQTTKGAAA